MTPSQFEPVISGQNRSQASLLIRGIALSALVAALGCDDGAEEAAAPKNPFAGQTVTLALPRDVGSDAIKLVLDEWSEQTGAKYRVIEYDPNDSSGAWGQGDLIVFPFARIGELSADDRLQRIPPAQLRAEGGIGWLDVFSGLRERILSMGGGPGALAFSCPVLTCYVRRDLLEKAGLKPPRTWDEYDALVNSLPNWAPGLIAAEPWGSDFRATMFLARALAYVKHPATYSVFFDIDSGAPLIDSPGFVRALTDAAATASKLPADSKSHSPLDCRRLILEGKAAIAVAYEPGRTDDRPIGRKADVALSFVRLPGTRTVYDRKSQSWDAPRDLPINDATLAPFAGLAGGVRRGIAPASAEAAWNLALFLSLQRYEQAFANVSKSVCRESQLNTAVSWLGPDLHSDEAYAFIGASAESLRSSNIVAELPVVGHARFREALAQGVTDAIEGKAKPDAALRSVAERWNAISKEIGVERVRDSYRKSLGLSPALNLPDLQPTSARTRREEPARGPAR